MREAVIFLAAPFVMSLILAGIHCYLGLHVLERGIIFVDLSLAQVAAFGIALGLLLGFAPHSTPVYFFSLFMTFIASGIFALSRRHESIFPQEAVIGIMFALSSAAVVVAAERMAHGLDYVKDLLAGQILWVTWGDVFRTAIIYSIVGMIHYIYRKQFIKASFNKKAEKTMFWDFMFYVLFGVVITSSVSIAGVLQVFSYLIVPSLVSTLFFKSIKARLLFGWAFGFLVSFVALALSYRWDLPTGPFIVVCFAVMPILLLLYTSLFSIRKAAMEN
jgi:zinc/manganese transport system permease protein